MSIVDVAIASKNIGSRFDLLRVLYFNNASKTDEVVGQKFKCVHKLQLRKRVDCRYLEEDERISRSYVATIRQCRKRKE